MSPERWEQVKRIVNACVEMDTERRAAAAVEACGDDSELASAVRSVLDSYTEAGEFLETPAVELNRGGDLAGTEIGPYRLIERIGEGGMGEVYRAARASDFEKRVAIKLVKRGMDTDFVLQRFRHERQILAELDHPNIARLIDGGAAGGRPYLVMDYVEGTPITEYAEKHGLDTEARLRLFRAVCSAVQYAHQNLVVHRDLKAGNILVTEAGEPKLLDFGIAKLLEPNADATIAPIRMMTPECASPEQVRGEPITTATDVYALGVLLYDLLTGQRPYGFETRTPEEIARVVCEQQPKRPSTVRPLPPDLDNIVLKAMHKDPSLRYRSVAHLSEDIQRYLEGRPVLARKDTFRYRAGKFIRRHKAATAAAVLAVASLAAAMAATLWEAHVARLERAQAERRFRQVRALTNSLLFELHDAIRPLPGSTPARKLIVDRALQYLDDLAREASGDLGLRRELAAAYVRLGRVQGQFGEANLGDGPGASRSFQKAVTLWEQVVAANPSSDNRRSLAGAYDYLGNVNPLPAKEEYYRRALEIRKKLSAELPPLEAAKEMANSYHNLGMARVNQGDNIGALAQFQNYLEACKRVEDTEPSAGNETSLSLAHKRVGALLILQGKLLDALSHYQAAAEIDQKLIEQQPDDADLRLNATFAQSDIAYIYWCQRDLKRALAEYHKIEPTREQLAAVDPNNERAKSSLTSVYIRIGCVLSETGDLKAAVRYGDKALARMDGDRTQDYGLVLEIANAYTTLSPRSPRPGDQLALWKRAKDWYTRAATLKNGAAGHNVAAELAPKIARCDAAIAGLQ